MEQNDEIWVLGATGRIGAPAAAILAKSGAHTVLIGRDASRLDAIARDIGASRTLVAEDAATMAAAVRRERPAVVVNTIGPFSRTAGPLAEACLPSTSYVDLANDMEAATAITALGDAAQEHGQTLVTGAGFGVVGTEAPLAFLCEGRPSPTRVRVDSAASVATAAGKVGHALADTIVEGFSEQGRQVRDGRLTPVPIGSSPQTFSLPDGTTVTTGAWPSGDLEAARRTSGAPEVVAATTAIPTGLPIRIALPLARTAMRSAQLRRALARLLAAMKLSEKPRPREHTWGRASAQWADGSSQVAWLRTDDAMEFTTRVLAETALRILAGKASPGAGTPIELLGPDLVGATGGEIYRA